MYLFFFLALKPGIESLLYFKAMYLFLLFPPQKIENDKGEIYKLVIVFLRVALPWHIFEKVIF